MKPANESDQQVYDSIAAHFHCSKAAQDVVTERVRQIVKEGFSLERDDTYEVETLARAGAAYALAQAHTCIDGFAVWPWPAAWWKPTTTRRNLVKAAALLLAAIERLDRAEATKHE